MKKNNSIFGILFSIIFLSPNMFFSQVCFSNLNNNLPGYTEVATSVFGYGLITVDLNNDGKADLLNGLSSGSMRILLGTGTGSFSSAGTYTPFFASVAADFNNDGNTDIVGGGKIALGTGTGTFGAASFVGIGADIAADFNLDGNMDVAGLGTNGITVNLGTGTGSFGAAASYTSGISALYITAKDFNGDTKPDIAVANYTANSVSVFINTGTGTFGAPTTFTSGIQPQYINSADFNNDGNNDLVITNYNTYYVTVFYGTGTGSFNPPVTFKAGYQATGLTHADFNNDGLQDIAVSQRWTNSINVLYGAATGSFTAPYNYGVNYGPEDIVAADFNNDGKIDLSVYNYNAGTISTLLKYGSTVFACLANYETEITAAVKGDFNNDGFLDIANTAGGYQMLLNNGSGYFGLSQDYTITSVPYSMTSGDFNKDSNLDVAIVTSTAINVCFGNGTGALSAPTIYTISWAGKIITYDFDNDTNLDLAYPSAPNAFKVLLGSPSGTFSSGTSFTTAPGANSYYIISADFNNDNKLDIATANNGLSSISILLGTGTASFGPSSTFTVGNNCGLESITAGDFNGDGKIDLAAARGFNDDVVILIGNGLGNFVASGTYTVGTWPRYISSSDINNDGYIDLVTNNYNSNNLSILYGNGSGSFPSIQTYSLIPNTKPVFLLTGDFDASGTNDIVSFNNTSSNASFLFNMSPTVTLTTASNTVCTSATGGSSVSLLGNPSGGLYSGISVTGSQFNAPLTAGNYNVVYSYTNSSSGCIGNASKTITVSVCTDIIEGTAHYVTQIYPNPTNGQFNLAFDKPKQNTEIKIFNSLGQIVLQKNISSTSKISLSISDQPSGIYFVEVNADGESYRAKVVKE